MGTITNITHIELKIANYYWKHKTAITKSNKEKRLNVNTPANDTVNIGESRQQ